MHSVLSWASPGEVRSAVVAGHQGRQANGRLVTGDAGRFRLECRAAGTVCLAASLQGRNAHEDHTGPQHAEVLGGGQRNINHPPAMASMHAVVDLDDGAAVVIDAANGDLGTERKMIAGGGKLLHIEALAGRRLAPLEALAVEAGLAMQARPIVIENIGRPEVAGRQGKRRWFARRLLGRPGWCRLGRCLLARRPDSRRGLAQQQAAAERRSPPCDVRPPRSALRHPGGPE